MKIFRLLVPIALAAVLFTIATAATAEDVARADTDLLTHFRALYPNTEFTSVQTTPLEGVYEVVMGQNVAYSDIKGKFFLFGHLFEMETQRDLTAGVIANLTKVRFDTLPLAAAIKRVKGNGTRMLAVFSDPDCPYCKSLEPELAKLEDVTIYTFLLPLEQLHHGAHEKAVAVWCAPAKEAAWDAVMRGETVGLAVHCQNPIDSNIQLAAALHINGTPTMIAADGRVKPGLASADVINGWLNQQPVADSSGEKR